MKRPIMFCAILATACTLQAKVRWGLGRGETGLIPASDTAFRKGYVADLALNEGEAQFILWGSPREPESVVSDLADKARAVGARSAFATGGSMAWGCVIQSDGSLERFLVTSGEGRYSHVFHFRQSARDFAASSRPPARMPFDAPVPASGKLISSFRDRSSAIGVATLELGGDDDAPAYLDQLLAQGWARAPARTHDTTLLVRGQEVLYASLKRSGGSAAPLVVLVHKRLGGRFP